MLMLVNSLLRNAHPTVQFAAVVVGLLVLIGVVVALVTGA